MHLHCLNRHTVFYFSFSSEITVTFGCPTVLLVPFYFAILFSFINMYGYAGFTYSHF